MMASEDVLVATFLWKMAVPLSCALAVHFLFLRGRYQTMYNRFYAFNLEGFARRYGRKTVKHKMSLFQNMKSTSERPGGRMRILEIGAGTGANFEYYPAHCEVVCLDPKPEFNAYLRNASKQCPDVRVSDLVVGSGEDLSAFHDGSFDAVVCTLVLCSVHDVDRVLREVRRVLKQGGQFYFFEHVSADWEKHKLLYIVQTMVSPIWRLAADGCVFNKPTWQFVRNAGFASVEMEFFELNVKFFTSVIKPHIKGIATK